MKRCTKCLVGQREEDFHKGQTRCKACASAYRKSYYLAHRDEERQRNAEYAREHTELCSGLSRRWRQANPEKMRVARAKWEAANPGKTRAAIEAWAARFPEKRRARLALRRATQKKATPKWADQDAIRLIYRMATVAQITFGQQVEVDHIAPLRGKTVCGLHCHTNLQLLFTSQNRRKSARWSVA